MNPKKTEKGASVALAIATKKRRVEKAASNSKKHALKAKASDKGKVNKEPTMKKVATKARIGKGRNCGRKTTTKMS